MDLEGAVAVVTGGTGTIGATIAQHLRRAGSRAVAWDRDAVDGDDSIIPVDVSDPASVDAAMVVTLQRHGVPRILVNAAGVSGGLATLADQATTDEDWSSVLSTQSAWDTVLKVNVLGVVNTSRAFARVIAEVDRDARAAGANPGGSIVNISSTSSGPITDPALAAYSASKAAANMVTKLAAVDFGPLGIRVNAVAPGFMETRMKPMPTVSASATPPHPTAGKDTSARVRARTPLGARLGQPDDIAETVVAVLRTGFVTGQVVYVEGGLTQHSLLRA
jgi:NAD(P)-dependent dehydrogenase (short-subunit alcohol dehydrogenase family)